MIALIHIEVDRDRTMLKPARNVGVQCEYVLNYRKEKIIIILAQYHYINKQINHAPSLFVASIDLRFFSRGSIIILTLDGDLSIRFEKPSYFEKIMFHGLMKKTFNRDDGI